MKILLLSMDYPPRYAGGTTIHTQKLAHALADLGHEVSVISAWAEGPEWDGPVRVIRVRRPYTLFSGLKARKIHREYDAVHGHGICAYGFMRMTGAHPVVKMHNVWSQEYRAYRAMGERRFSMLAYIRMDRYVARRASHLICISDYVKSGAMEYGVPEERITVIRNGVDPEMFRNLVPREIDLERPVVMYAGRLAPHKGVDILIRAMARVKKGSLLVVGKGPSGEDLRRMCLDLDVKARFIGAVRHDDLPSYYAAADVVVYPSLYEPLGNVVLEAMASGTPVIASDTGGIPEILPPDAGFLFSGEDDLVHHLEVLLSDEDLRRRMGSKGREIALSRTWHDVALETVDVLRRSM